MTYKAKGPGNCFEDNLMTLLCDERFRDWSLVHGIAIRISDGLPFSHAWLERDGWVFDASHQKMVPSAIFYEVGKVSVTVKHDLDEARVSLDLHEHCGPWDENFEKVYLLADAVMDRVVAEA